MNKNLYFAYLNQTVSVLLFCVLFHSIQLSFIYTALYCNNIRLHGLHTGIYILNMKS